jgi:hypothetical protein
LQENIPSRAVFFYTGVYWSKSMKKATFTILFLALVSFGADTTYVDSSLYIKVTLPQSWVAFGISDSSLMIASLDSNYKANLFVTRYKTAEFQSAREWTQSYFVAYSEFVKSSHEPYAKLLWFDSTTSAALQPTSPSGSAWAPWLYAEFQTVDTTGIIAWGEYERFTANKNFGYEMYAISDTLDMKANYTQYAAILKKIELLDNSSGIIIRPVRYHYLSALKSFENDPGWYTVTGRRIRAGKSIMSSGFYLNRKTKAILLRP